MWFPILHKVTLSAAIRSRNDWNLTEIIEQAPNERPSLDITDFFNQAIPPHTYLGLSFPSVTDEIKFDSRLVSLLSQCHWHNFPSPIAPWLNNVCATICFTRTVPCVTRHWFWIYNTTRHASLAFYIVYSIITRNIILGYFCRCYNMKESNLEIKLLHISNYVYY